MMAARLRPLGGEFELPGVPVSVTIAPLAPVVTVYVTGLPVFRGPAVAVCAGVVIVAPPVDAPPMTDWTAAGTK